MAKDSNLSEKDKRELEAFGALAAGMEPRRQELLAAAHRRAEAELQEYRDEVLASLRELLSRYSIAQIVRLTGIARSTVYRWGERLKQEEAVALAVSQGRAPENLPGGLGGLGAPRTARKVEPVVIREWGEPKRTFSGEVSVTDPDGDVWILSDDGQAWNKTGDKVRDGFDNWPAGAKEVFDSLR